MQHTQDTTPDEPQPQAPAPVFPAYPETVHTIGCGRRLFAGGPVYRVLFTTCSYRSAEGTLLRAFHIRSDIRQPRPHDRTNDLNNFVIVGPVPAYQCRLNATPTWGQFRTDPYLSFPPLHIRHIDEFRHHTRVPDHTWSLSFGARHIDDADGDPIVVLDLYLFHSDDTGPSTTVKRWNNVLLYRNIPNPALRSFFPASSSQEN